MALVVTKNSKGHYEVELAEPESQWVDELADALSVDELTILTMVLGEGLLHLMNTYIEGTMQKPTEDSKQ